MAEGQPQPEWQQSQAGWMEKQRNNAKEFIRTEERLELETMLGFAEQTAEVYHLQKDLIHTSREYREAVQGLQKAVQEHDDATITSTLKAIRAIEAGQTAA